MNIKIPKRYLVVYVLDLGSEWFNELWFNPQDYADWDPNVLVVIDFETMTFSSSDNDSNAPWYDLGEKI